ncbi:MAG TPA: 23S rRNA (uracil(1939)-C(5))-methyltransferase RlmD [Gammaproteobacteria bacterium]|nr:23S rRNA (uracil(1939)-C(5))-methyltransferase RlmD [Gammaproteobacteria bacterium]
MNETGQALAVSPPGKGRERELFTARVTALADDGRGVAEVEGRPIYIEGALPGETVRFHYLRRRKRSAGGRTVEVLQASPRRVVPPCAHADRCGGCRLQHLDPAAQLAFKEKHLRERLEACGGLAPAQWLPSLEGPHLHYRRRARLGARYIASRGGVLVGFRARASSYILSLEACQVLDSRLGGLMPGLERLLGGLSCPDRIPQIEVAAGDAAAALVFRHLVPLNEEDLYRLADFGRAHGLQIHLQPKGPDSCWCLYPGPEAVLAYRLPVHDVEIRFRPTDFIQVNGEVNRLMVDQALALLAPDPGDTVLDLFCGLGNFTLPLARQAGRVIGLEMNPALVAGAAANARRNGITNAEFHQVDLREEAAGDFWSRYRPDKVLLDPARDGAMEFIKRMPRARGPGRLVYISCNPATLARDAEYLVRVLGYRLTHAGVVDMFPHTAHAEAMAVFERT